MKPIIKVENISKQYHIGAAQPQFTTLRDSLSGVLQAPLNWLRRNGHSDENTIWALKDVSFDVMPGEVVGIIGRNGAGKSTLLKILSRITEPTSGQIDLYGRVGSLLEVGTGFHQELSGRENVYLNGAILGMKRSEINRKFDEIVAFAEIDKFIDTPVKHYSSGMYMRLAFAVAAHLEPEILLIDEVLAVGDFAFQQKCIQKAGEAASEGRTVLLVSHNMGVLGEIAKRAIWVDSGRINVIGELQEVIRSYVMSESNTEGAWLNTSTPNNIPAFITKASIRQGESQIVSEVMIDKPFEIEITYAIRKKMSFCRVGVIVSNTLGTIIFSSAELDDSSISSVSRGQGEYKTRCTIPEWLLAPGGYYLTLHIDDAPLKRLFTVDKACNFVIVENIQRGIAHYSRPGVIAPKLSWSLSVE